MTTEPRDFARHLRAHATRAEETLWKELRGRKLGGAKFRRQVPLLTYTLDFVCLERHLVVELDGRGHEWQREYDEGRTQVIEAQGFQVLRFTNDLVLNNIGVVMTAVRAALRPEGA